MSRTRNKIIQSLAPMLVVGAIVAPSAGASERTATELGQSTNLSASATPSGQSSERTATELGQSTDSSLAARTATELGQSTDISPPPTPGSESSGFDWDDVALVGGGVLGLVLIGVGGVVLISRRRGGVRKPRTPAVSS
jgi:hypothetical protein